MLHAIILVLELNYLRRDVLGSQRYSSETSSADSDALMTSLARRC